MGGGGGGYGKLWVHNTGKPNFQTKVRLFLEFFSSISNRQTFVHASKILGYTTLFTGTCTHMINIHTNMHAHTHAMHVTKHASTHILYTHIPTQTEYIQ